MKKIEDVRRDNLKRLRDELGSVQELADTIGKGHSQVSQWLNASTHSASGKPRSVSSASCREIEKAIGKPEGWMDVEHGDLKPVESTKEVELRRVLADASAEVRLLSVYRFANADQRELINSAVRLVIDQLDIADILTGRS
jgi:transcriptional regulator with XRE-family HTH domain